MIEATVLTCKKSEFPDRKNAGQVVSGYTVGVRLPGSNGWIEVWSKVERSPNDIVNLEITEGKFHKPKVRIV